jgi:hypothetical protein
MVSGKFAAWIMVLSIVLSCIPTSAAATNPATLTYSGTSTGDYAINLSGFVDAESVNINIQSSQVGAGGVLPYWIQDDDYLWLSADVGGSSTSSYYVTKTTGYSPSGTDVFLFFDNFPGSSLNTSKWTNNAHGTVSISGGKLTYTGTTANWGQLESKTTFSRPVILEQKTRFQNRATGRGAAIGFRTADNNHWAQAIYFGSINWIRNKASGSETNVNSNIDTTERIYTTTWTSSAVSWAKDGTAMTGSPITSNVPTVGIPVLFETIGGSGYGLVVDWVFVRQYAASEPTVSVTDMGTYYRVDITNNEATALSGYQVRVPATSLGITSSSESLKITDSLGILEFELTAAVTGSSVTQSFNEENTQRSYVLYPTNPINQIQFTVDDQTAAYEYEVTVHFNNTAPSISNLSPTGGLQNLQVTFSADIQDPDMNNGYDSVAVDFYVAGVLIDTVNATESGTVSTGPHTYAIGGTYAWYVVATDEHGGVTQSDIKEFSVPNQFNIRDAVTLQLVDVADVEVMFYEQGELQLTVVKSTDIGTVDLIGLPVDSEFVVVVKADGYLIRNTLIETIFDQNSIYIIPTTTPHNEIVLEITDYTGNFPIVDSKIFIQRAIDIGIFDPEYEPGTYKWETMSGDFIGADQRFQDHLIDGERYRFVLKNTKGETRVIGQYNSLRPETLNLVVGQLRWDFARKPGYNAEVRFVDTTSDGQIENGIIRFQFLDDADLTTSISVVCYERGNLSNVIYTDSVSGTFGEYAASIPIIGNQLKQNWVVDYTITRGGEISTYSMPISPGGGFLDWPIDGKWGAFVLGLLLLFFALMWGGAMASKGAIITCGIAAALWFPGWRLIPISVIIFAGIVSVLFLIGDTAGDGMK